MTPTLQENDPIAGHVRAAVLAVMNLDDIADDRNLIELGANSMELIRIINRIENELRVRMEFADLLSTPTVRSLAQMLRSQSAHAGSGPQAALATGTAGPPPPAQQRAAPGNGLRSSDGPAWTLPGATRADRGRSVRRFARAPMPVALLGELLSCLRLAEEDGRLRGGYASASASFCVQVYVYVKTGALMDIGPGLYYYHPVSHELRQLVGHVIFEPSIYEPVMNAPMFDGAGIAIYLVSRPAAIESNYGAKARDYCLIEAGSMAQLLRENAARVGVGLCTIGDMNFAAVRSWFELEAGQECLQSFVGGMPATQSGELPAVTSTIEEHGLESFRVR